MVDALGIIGTVLLTAIAFGIGQDVWDDFVDWLCEWL